MLKVVFLGGGRASTHCWVCPGGARSGLDLPVSRFCLWHGWEKQGCARLWAPDAIMLGGGSTTNYFKLPTHHHWCSFTLPDICSEHLISANNVFLFGDRCSPNLQLFKKKLLLLLFALVNFQVGSYGFFCPGLTLDHNSPAYSLRCSWDHRHMLPCLAYWLRWGFY
jgi:hypothetical protein